MLINYNPDYTLYIVGTSIFAQELESWITNDITGKITSISPDEYFTLPDYSQCILGFQNIIYRKDFLLSGNRLARSWPIYIHPTAFVTDKNLINKELDRYRAVTAEEIQNESKIIFDEKNCNTLYYYSNN